MWYSIYYLVNWTVIKLIMGIRFLKGKSFNTTTRCYRMTHHTHTSVSINSLQSVVWTILLSDHNRLPCLRPNSQVRCNVMNLNQRLDRLAVSTWPARAHIDVDQSATIILWRIAVALMQSAVCIRPLQSTSPRACTSFSYSNCYSVHWRTVHAAQFSDVMRTAIMCRECDL